MSVCISDINVSDLDLSVNSDIGIRLDISVMNQIDAALYWHQHVLNTDTWSNTEIWFTHPSIQIFMSSSNHLSFQSSIHPIIHLTIHPSIIPSFIYSSYTYLCHLLCIYPTNLSFSHPLLFTRDTCPPPHPPLPKKKLQHVHCALPQFLH